MVLETAKASTSGTSVDFTGIPSWVKRVTVMFNGVSLSGSSDILVQIGSGSFTSSGYTSNGFTYNSTNATGGSSSNSGFMVALGAAANALRGTMFINLHSGSLWVSTHNGLVSTVNVVQGAGDVSLSGALDRVRITTVNGTDTFDAGSINILYEG